MKGIVGLGKKAAPLVLAGLLASGAAFASSGDGGPPSTENLVGQGLPSGPSTAPGGLPPAGSGADAANKPAIAAGSAPTLGGGSDAGGHGYPPQADGDRSGGAGQLSAAKQIIADLNAPASSSGTPGGLLDGNLPSDQFLDGQIHSHGTPGADGSSMYGTGAGSDGSDGSADEEDKDDDRGFPFGGSL